MIPHVLHWVWLGENPLPERDKEWMASWLRINGMPCTVWAEHPDRVCAPAGFSVRPLPPLVNQQAYDTINRYVTHGEIAARSDIVRYEIVARYGGIYLDTDVECFQPISALLEGVRLFVSDEWGPCPGNFMFGATANHPAMWTVVRELVPHLRNFKKGRVNPVLATGPHYLNAQLRKSPELVIYPHMLFNPLCAFDDPDQVVKWPSCSFGNHRYDGKWYERKKRKPPAEFLA